MGYKRLTTMDILEILRRIDQGQTIKFISKTLGYDRKTLRKYINAIKNNVGEDPEKIIKQIKPELKGRPKEKQNLLDEFKEEINNLINNNSLKPKSVFDVICKRHELDDKLSYSSFKRFIRQNKLNDNQSKTTCRLEFEPGSQIQVDYCKVGLINDGSTGKRRTVYAFIGTLSYSRHKYVEFVFSQNQKSFIESHINMFNYFGGVPVTVKLDNLKSGVIKADLYDPQLNKAYAEMAEHFGLFLDPCRAAKPKDKGIVERDVQTIREEFKKLLALNSLITINEANEAIKHWIIETYGKRKHGTTNEEPYTVFQMVEQPVLLSLPYDEYEISEWKTAAVHPDHYLQVDKKFYSMPDEFIGKEVMVKIKHNIVSVYFQEELVKQHTVPLGNRQTDINDFPDNMHHRLDTGMPFYLRKQASEISLEFEKLIYKILSPNAYINLRRAQAIIRIAKNYSKELIELSSKTALENYSNVHPKLFLSIIEKHQQLSNQNQQEQLFLSEETSSFIREADYYIH
jgi:transposase